MQKKCQTDKFAKLRLWTVGKKYVPRMKLYALCLELGVSNEELSAATGARFSAEFFRSLGDEDKEDYGHAPHPKLNKKGNR